MCWMWRKITEVQIRGILVPLNRVCVSRSGRNVNVDGHTFRAILCFNCFKKHLNNTQTTAPPAPQTNKNGVYLKDAGGLEMPPRAGLGIFLSPLVHNPWLIMGTLFSSEGAYGHTCGQGSCDNPLWPLLRYCKSSCLEGEFLLQEDVQSILYPLALRNFQSQTWASLKVLVARCSGEVVLECSLQMVCKLPMKLPGLLLGRCPFHIQNCAPDGWGNSWISTTDRGDTAQPRKQGKVRKNMNQNR